MSCSTPAGVALQICSPSLNYPAAFGLTPISLVKLTPGAIRQTWPTLPWWHDSSIISSLYRLSIVSDQTFLFSSLLSSIHQDNALSLGSLQLETFFFHQFSDQISIMCYRIVERYSVCRCLYYKHSVDQCSAVNTRGHTVEERTILVGYLCPIHSAKDLDESHHHREYADSGYGSRDSQRLLSRRYGR